MTDSVEEPPSKSGPGFFCRMAKGFAKWSDRWGPRIFLLILVLTVIVVAFFDRIFIFIHSGEQGVLWYRFFGTDTKHHYREGTNVIFPWDQMYIYDTRAQQVSDRFNVLSRNGLNIQVEVSIRFRPQKQRLPLLHVEIGPDYIEKVVKPEVRANMRYLIGQYTPDEIYTSQGLLVRRTVESAAPELAERYITLEDLLIKSIALPKTVQDAIEQKLKQQQEFLEYEYRIRKEEREKERKIIEAEGVQAFQNLINTGDSSFDKHLSYLGIQATLELAKSNNAKVVVIGGGEEGLPLILNLPEEIKVEEKLDLKTTTELKANLNESIEVKEVVPPAPAPPAGNGKADSSNTDAQKPASKAPVSNPKKGEEKKSPPPASTP